MSPACTRIVRSGCEVAARLSHAPSHAAPPMPGSRRLQVAVEVVDPQQLELGRCPCARSARLVGARVEAEQRNEKSGRKGGRPGQQVTAVDAWHGCKVWAICRRFVAESCR